MEWLLMAHILEDCCGIMKCLYLVWCPIESLGLHPSHTWQIFSSTWDVVNQPFVGALLEHLIYILEQTAALL